MTETPPPPARMVKCPTCRKQTKFTPGNIYRPFCSERCKVIDIGAWAEEKYAIPVAPTVKDLDSELDANLESGLESPFPADRKIKTDAELAAELGINPADIANAEDDEDY